MKVNPKGALSPYDSPRSRIVTFLVITMLLSTIPWVASAVTGEISELILLTPGLAAFLTVWLYGSGFRDLGWRFKRPRLLVVAWVLPIALGAIVYGGTWAAISGSFQSDGIDTSEFFLEFLNGATIGVILFSLFALFEEIGWRGFLVPELAKITNFWKTSVISGIIWAAWHFPLIILVKEEFDFAGTPTPYALIVFTLSLVAVSFSMTWLRLASGGLWVAVIMHGSHNSISLDVLNDWNSTDGAAPYVAGEVGLGLLAAWVIVGYIFWRRRSAVES
jgi:membrane protease YdiL (CAAX protease family)